MGGKYFLPLMCAGLLAVFGVQGQQPVDVAETSVKVGIKGEEVVYYGFAAGDQLIFSFEEGGGKEMKEVEIVEMPSTSRYMDFKIAKLEKKTISVPRTGIYKFRFANSALVPRVCKYKIQRIPASAATQDFNTTVYFDEYNDTTYVTEIQSYIDRSDTVISNLQDRTIKVNPLTAPGTSKAVFNFTLPENTVAWSYYICTDKIGQQLYLDAVKEVSSNSGRFIEKFPKYSPLAAVAMDAPNYINRMDSGQFINYWIVENENAELFRTGEQFRFIKKGRGINDFSRMEPLDRTFYFCLHNDSKEKPVSVYIKITAVGINETLASKEFRRMQVIPRKGMHLKN